MTRAQRLGVLSSLISSNVRVMEHASLKNRLRGKTVLASSPKRSTPIHFHHRVPAAGTCRLPTSMAMARPILFSNIRASICCRRSCPMGTGPSGKRSTPTPSRRKVPAVGTCRLPTSMAMALTQKKKKKKQQKKTDKPNQKKRDLQASVLHRHLLAARYRRKKQTGSRQQWRW